MGYISQHHLTHLLCFCFLEPYPHYYNHETANLHLDLILQHHLGNVETPNQGSRLPLNSLFPICIAGLATALRVTCGE
jgi:hypothetical protein